jgi:uncharacterized phiE125 gp8 family phage protein
MSFFAAHVPTPDGRYRSVRRLTQPAAEPVSLAEAKSHLRVDTADDDAYITTLIKAAREWIEEYLDRSLVYTQWQVKADLFPVEFEVPRPPIAAAGTFTAVTLTYEATDGTTKTVASADFRVDRDATPAVVRNVYNGTWPSDAVFDANAVTLTFWAGYGADATNVPQVVKHACLYLISHWFENRMPVVGTGAVPQQMPLTVRSLLDSVQWGLYR